MISNDPVVVNNLFLTMIVIRNVLVGLWIMSSNTDEVLFQIK